MSPSNRRGAPEVSLSIKNGDSINSGDLSLAAIGLGIHQSWIYATMFGATTMFAHTSKFDGAFGTQLTTEFIVSILTLCICLLAFGLMHEKVDKTLDKPSVLITAGILTSLGSFMLVIPGLPTDLLVIFEILSGILTGIGSSALIITWGVIFSRMDLLSIALNTIFAIAIAYFLYSFVLAPLLDPVGGCVAACLPLIELPLLLKSGNSNMVLGDLSHHFKPHRVNMGAFLLSFGIPMLIFGLALGLLRHLCIENATSLSAQGSMTAIVFAMAIALIRVILFSTQEESWSLDFRGIIPLIVVAVAFIPATLQAESEWAAILILTTYLCFETLTWTYFAEICQAFRISPLLVVGAGRGLMAVGTLISSGIMIAIKNAIIAVGSEDELVLFLILTLIIAFTLLPNKNSFKHLVILDSKVKTPSIVRDSAADDKDATMIPGGKDETFTDGSPSSNETNATAATAIPEPAETTQSQPTPRLSAHPPLKPNMTPEETTKLRKGWFRKKCEAVSDLYMLSAREQEVLFYLAKGFNAGHIQEKLYISEGTTKTHMRHIYRKLDVHSQQALIRLVEETEIEADF